MSRFPDELRLLILLAANAIVLTASIRFVRRRGVNDGPQVALDAMLLWYLVQYLSITIPGLIGILSASSMIATAVILSVALWVIPGRIVAPIEKFSSIERWIVMACIVVMCAFTFSVIWTQRIAPPTSNDALTYHLPAAVQWLRTGRITLFETWFFNPANTYSPLAGSTFIAWLFAPIGNDAIAQFVQAPVLLMIFFAALQLCRAMGTNTSVAAIVALSACCARPLISQTVLTKDDLFVVAFFGAAIVGLASDRRSAWRIGVALGLMLACKYTAILLVPILFLARWNRRDLAVVLSIVALIAGPWFLRNLVFFGNPVFPMFTMLTTTRSRELTSFHGAWRALVDNYSAMPIAPTIALMFVWVVALIRNRRKVLKQPVVRLVLIGPVIGFGIFLIASPYPEARFVYPCYLLLFAAGAWAAPGLLVISIATSFVPHVLANLCLPFAAMFVVLMIAVHSRRIGAIALASLLLISVYVYWHAYLVQRRESAADYWRLTYGPLGSAWEFARSAVPANAPLAYANTSFVYPLLGEDFSRVLIYVPVRADVQTIANIGHLDGRITGENLVDRVVQKMNENANEDAWLARLQADGVHYIFIAKRKQASPEMQFAEGNSHFHRVFDNSAASVFEIEW